MKQSSKRLISALLALALIVFAIILFVNFIQPAFRVTSILRSEIASREQLIQNEKDIVAKVKSFIDQYKNNTSLRDSISAAIPTNSDEGGAMATLNLLAGAHRLSLESLSLGGSSGQATGSGSGAAGAKPGARASIIKPIGTLAVQARLTGNYEDLKLFLDDLERNIRLADIKNLQIQTGPKTSPTRLTYNLNFVTYYLK